MLGILFLFILYCVMLIGMCYIKFKVNFILFEIMYWLKFIMVNWINILVFILYFVIRLNF